MPSILTFTSLQSAFHTLITPTEILSYLAAADVFILGMLTFGIHHQWSIMKKMSTKHDNFITSDDYSSPLIVYIVAVCIALDITLFYNYTIMETVINQVLVIFVDLLYLYFNDEIHND